MTCPRSHGLSGAELGPEPTLLSPPASRIFRVSIDWLLTLPLSPQPPTVYSNSLLSMFAPNPCSCLCFVVRTHQSEPHTEAVFWHFSDQRTQMEEQEAGLEAGSGNAWLPRCVPWESSRSLFLSGFNSSESIRDFPWD